ncbi:MEDS domain-containing protein [Alkalihalobacillus sp. CinArs1]|uniref:MEDS domain-containing protein n=1 Tax=Alkalihalobacillus sp. CinArs1 TaxID=2995314 RepID=UPI0022DD4013|nr:MEDS domain-containing protein [Alkalihalobacillus sp. CinArs1]
MKSEMNRLFEDKRCVHVLYAYQGRSNYVKQVLGFIQDGIKAGEHVILIENEPVYRLIEKELSRLLTEEDRSYVHRINNFDFYFSSGSYHPPAIVEHFQKSVEPFVENNVSFRSWAHVEWASMEEPLHIIEDFERIVDRAVHEYSFPLICAYEDERMPDYLIDILMETHPYVLMEEEFITSKQYQA